MLGNLLADSYERSVTQRGNTSLRIGFAYREAVDAVLGSGAITFADPHIGFGDIEFVPSVLQNGSFINFMSDEKYKEGSSVIL